MSLHQVVWAELAGGTLEVSLLARHKKKDALALLHIAGDVADGEAQAVADFVSVLMDASYKGALAFVSALVAHLSIFWTQVSKGADTSSSSSTRTLAL